MKSTPSSPIDRHQYIILVRIISARAGEWSPDTRESGSQSILRRIMRIEARVHEVLKSPVGGSIAQDLKFEVEQRKPADGFTAEDYGPWSELDSVAGIDLLIFANDSKPHASVEQAVAEGCGLLIRIPSAQVPYAVEDVRHALAWEQAVGRRVLDSAQIRLSINERKAASGPLMASYLVESLAGRDIADAAKAHEFLIGLLLAPEVNSRFRLVVLAHEINELTMSEAPPAWFRSRLIKAMIQMLEDEGAESLHDSIRQTYLINSVLDASGKPLVPARDVLSSDSEREAFESMLQRRKFAPEQQTRLLHWIRAE